MTSTKKMLQKLKEESCRTEKNIWDGIINEANKAFPVKPTDIKPSDQLLNQALREIELLQEEKDSLKKQLSETTALLEKSLDFLGRLRHGATISLENIQEYQREIG